MNMALTLLLVAGASANLVGRMRDIRGAASSGALDRLAFAGGALVLLGGIWAVFWGLGVAVGPRAWLNAMGAGHGALESTTQLAGLWALGGGAVLLVGERVRRAAAGRWAALATSLVGLGAVLFSVWLIHGPQLAALGLSSQSAAVLAASNGALLAAGLSFVLLSALVVSYDEALSHASWLALGMLCASAAVAVVIGYSDAVDALAVFLPLTDANGVPVEIRFSLAEGEWLAVPAMHSASASMLGSGLAAVAVIGLAAGLVGSFHPRNGRMLFALMAVASIIVLAQLLGSVGPRGGLEQAEMIATIRGAGISPDMLVMPPTASSQAVAVHPSAVLPVGLVLWILAVVGAFRAMAPTGRPEKDTASYRPSQALALSRDAAALGSILLWAGLAVGLFGSVELVGRYVTSHQLGGFIAIAALAMASVMAWHAVLSKPSRTAFGAWCTLPALTLLVAALVMLSGVFTSGPATFLSVLP